MKNTGKDESRKRAKKPIAKPARIENQPDTPTPFEQIPEKIVPQKLADYLEIMTIAVFQAGTSWALIRNKWPGFRRAFSDFDPQTVSRYGAREVSQLLENPEIVRSAKKITGTIQNAKVMLQLDKEHAGFVNYLRSHKTYKALSADINRRFKYVGELSVYYFLFRIGESVPPFDEWITTIQGHHPRMKEMIDKDQGKRPTKQI
jgi:3-methyladenine DNA glycosylase Tag